MPREWDENGRKITAQPREWDERGNPITSGNARRGERRSPWEEAYGAVTSVTRGIPFYQDAVGALEGARTAATGGNFQEGFGRSQQEQQAWARDFRTRRPLAGAFAEGTGNAASVAPFIASGGAPAAAGLGRQMLNAGATGAAAAAPYGFATGDAPGMPLTDRLDRANNAAFFGGAIGAATPPVVAAAGALARPAWQALANPRLTATQAAESGAGAFGGQAFQGGRRPPAPRANGAAPQGPPVDPASIGLLDRLRDRSGQSVDDLEREFIRARRNPRGEVVADLFRDPGVRQARAIVQSPGQTGQRAADIAISRSLAQEDRIVGDLRNRMLNPDRPMTPTQATATLQAEYNQASTNLYNPLFQRQLPASGRDQIDSFLRRYANDPVLEDVQQRAARIFNRDVSEGLVEGGITDNLARYAHYLKMGIDDAARWNSNPASGIGRTELGSIRRMQGSFVRTLDEAIPGYRQARERWSTISNAEDALEAGQSMYSQAADDIAAYMKTATQFERDHARIGFVHSVSQAMGLRGNTERVKNIADVLGSPEMQRRVRAMFDDEQQAANFLEGLSAQNRLMQNAVQWGSGSQTHSNITHAMDAGVNAAADVGVQAVTGNVGGAVRRAVGHLGNAATLGHIERRNNKLGETLFRRVDSEEAADFTRYVIQELRRREQARATNAAVSQAGAAGAGTQQRPDRR